MSAKRKKKKKIIKHPNLRFFFKLVILLSLVTSLIIGIMFYVRYGETIVNMRAEARALVRQSSIDTFRQTETSLVYDTNGKLLSTLKGAKDVYYISYEDIPDYAKDAMISIEDKKFNKHNGIDLKAITRAFVELVRHKGEVTQGASTITQQLSRGIFLTHEVSWERKIKEMFIALEIEKKYQKYQIIEFYLNNIYFANGYYGIQAASKGYFSKNVKDLTLGQITFLCAIPNNPTIYDPLVNPDNTVKRKNRILDQMLLDGKITELEHDEAYNEEIILDTPSIAKKNYIETYVYYSATRALMKQRGFTFRNRFEDEEDQKNYERQYNDLYNECQLSLFNSGYRIYTSIDTKIQKQLQDSVNETLKGFTDKNKEGIYKLQGAATCIDNETGRVVAIVGGRSQKLTGFTLNRAYQSYRQPGSAIKPLIVYTPAFELGCIPSQIVEDKKTEDGPRNSNNVYEGKVTIRRAVEVSKNTVAWNIFTDLTPKVGLGYLLNMGFNRISPNDYYPAASLGGFTNGVSTVEMASAYAAIENDGIFREPTCIVKIMDSRGEEIVGDSFDIKPVYDRNASRMMTDVLVGVVKNGTGRGLGLSNMISAGKTGTTNDKKDGWFVGYTPYYTTSVWVGYDLPKTLSNLTGASYPGSIWHMFMESIHEGLEYKGFPKYEGAKNEATPEPTIEPTIDPVDDLLDEEGETTLNDIPDESEDYVKPTPTPVVELPEDNMDMGEDPPETDEEDDIDNIPGDSTAVP